MERWGWRGQRGMGVAPMPFGKALASLGEASWEMPRPLARSLRAFMEKAQGGGRGVRAAADG